MKPLLLVGASLAAVTAMPATAQDGPASTVASADEAIANDVIVVTGSRIATLNMESTVPVLTVSAVELAKTGEVDLTP